jgi:hypothetical protein
VGSSPIVSTRKPAGQGPIQDQRGTPFVGLGRLHRASIARVHLKSEDSAWREFQVTGRRLAALPSQWWRSSAPVCDDWPVVLPPSPAQQR